MYNHQPAIDAAEDSEHLQDVYDDYLELAELIKKRIEGFTPKEEEKTEKEVPGIIKDIESVIQKANAGNLTEPGFQGQIANLIDEIREIRVNAMRIKKTFSLHIPGNKRQDLEINEIIKPVWDSTLLGLNAFSGSDTETVQSRMEITKQMLSSLVGKHEHDSHSQLFRYYWMLINLQEVGTSLSKNKQKNKDNVYRSLEKNFRSLTNFARGNRKTQRKSRAYSLILALKDPDSNFIKKKQEAREGVREVPLQLVVAKQEYEAIYGTLTKDSPCAQLIEDTESAIENLKKALAKADTPLNFKRASVRTSIQRMTENAQNQTARDAVEFASQVSLRGKNVKNAQQLVQEIETMETELSTMEANDPQKPELERRYLRTKEALNIVRAQDVGSFAEQRLKVAGIAGQEARRRHTPRRNAIINGQKVKKLAPPRKTI